MKLSTNSLTDQVGKTIGDLLFSEDDLETASIETEASLTSSQFWKSRKIIKKPTKK